MSSFSKSEENYIEHEVQLRLHNEKFNLFDSKFEGRFNHLEKRIDKVDSKLNWLLGLVLSAVLLPVALHYLHLM